MFAHGRSVQHLLSLIGVACHRLEAIHAWRRILSSINEWDDERAKLPP